MTDEQWKDWIESGMTRGSDQFGLETEEAFKDRVNRSANYDWGQWADPPWCYRGKRIEYEPRFGPIQDIKESMFISYMKYGSSSSY
jgi:hypothetical protein